MACLDTFLLRHWVFTQFWCPSLKIQSHTKASQRWIQGSRKERGCRCTACWCFPEQHIELHCQPVFCRRRGSVSCVVQPTSRQKRQMSMSLWHHCTWGQASFYLVSPEHAGPGVWSQGLTGRLLCWSYWNVFCSSQRNDELFSETPT